MRAFMNCLLLLTVFMVFTTACGKDKKDKPVEPTPVHDPAPGPQPDPVPPQPDPGPSPDPTPVPDPEPDPTPEPDPVPEPIPDEPALDPSKTFKVNVKFSNGTAAQKAKYARAICIVKKVVAMESFKNKILGFDSPYTVNKFYDTGFSNAQIYQHILNGNEKLQPAIDNELDVEVQFYYAATTTIGYTYSNVNKIWVNTKYFDTFTPSSVASNLFHEWLHKLGYGHAASYTPSRDASVPYAIGYMVRTLGKPLEPSCP